MSLIHANANRVLKVKKIGRQVQEAIPVDEWIPTGEESRREQKKGGLVKLQRAREGDGMRA